MSKRKQTTIFIIINVIFLMILVIPMLMSVSETTAIYKFISVAVLILWPTLGAFINSYTFKDLELFLFPIPILIVILLTSTIMIYIAIVLGAHITVNLNLFISLTYFLLFLFFEATITMLFSWLGKKAYNKISS